MIKRLSNFWHETLKQPYNLQYTETPSNGSKTPVVLIHGIASDSTVWNDVIKYINTDIYQIITIDLLGFGKSPKPDTNSYNLTNHAKQIIHTIKKHHVKQPFILVGHSLGSLIAIEIMNTMSLNIKEMILCSPPLYVADDTDLPLDLKKSTKRKSNIYINLYSEISKRPNITLRATKLISNKLSGFTLDDKTWISFKKSLVNSINNQDSLNKLIKAPVKTVIIYGRLDILLVSKHFNEAATKNNNISLISYSGGHSLTNKYSKLIAKQINTLT